MLATRSRGELEDVTELIQARTDGFWQAVVWPEAGEATVYRHTVNASPTVRRRSQDGGGRACRAVRRYALANKLDALVTLTFRRAVRSESEVRSQLRTLLAHARKNVALPFPYVSVIEQHARHGLHVHLLVPHEVADVLTKAWRHGFANTRRYETADGIRRGAAYVAKTFGGSRNGAHRYEVAQGFQPVAERLETPDRAGVWRRVISRMGGNPTRVIDFLSSGWAVWLAWWDGIANPHRMSPIRT